MKRCVSGVVIRGASITWPKVQRVDLKPRLLFALPSLAAPTAQEAQEQDEGTAGRKDPGPVLARVVLQLRTFGVSWCFTSLLHCTTSSGVGPGDRIANPLVLLLSAHARGPRDARLRVVLPRLFVPPVGLRLPGKGAGGLRSSGRVRIPLPVPGTCSSARERAPVVPRRAVARRAWPKAA